MDTLNSHNLHFINPPKYELITNLRNTNFAVRKFVSLSYFVGISKEYQLIPN